MNDQTAALVYQVPNEVLCMHADGMAFVAPIAKILPDGVFIEAAGNELSYLDQVKISFIAHGAPELSIEGEVVSAVRGRGVRIEASPFTPEKIRTVLVSWSEGTPATVRASAVSNGGGAASPGDSSSASKKSAPMLTGTSVLVIDDDPYVLKAMERLLRGLGCKVNVTNDPPTGLEILFTERVDAILLDWMLPTIPGQDMLTELRASYADIPVAVISGGLWWDGADEYILDMGAQKILHKPLDMEQVVGWLASLAPRAA